MLPTLTDITPTDERPLFASATIRYATARVDGVLRDIVLKEYRKETDLQNAQKEFLGLSANQGQGVVSLLGFDSVKRILALERLAGDGFEKFLFQRSSFERKLYVLGDAARVLVHVASGEGKTAYIHGDINPYNLMVHGDKVHFFDFGMSMPVCEAGEVDVGKFSLYGTDPYAAPEAYPDSDGLGPYHANVSQALDVYSLGTVGAKLFSPGWFPQNRSTPSFGDDVPNALKNLLLSTREESPGNRPTARQFAQALERI